MFRHNDYVKNSKYPFNAGYVIYKNYFFPLTDTGEASEEPVKEFPKAFEHNFKYFVDTCLSPEEKETIVQTFENHYPFHKVAMEMHISTKELTVIRTRAFVKLRSLSRMRTILSDEEYKPKENTNPVITIGNLSAEIVTKVPTASEGGQSYRIIYVKQGDTSILSMRMSTKVNNMSEDDLRKFIVDMLSSLSKISL